MKYYLKYFVISKENLIILLNFQKILINFNDKQIINY